MLHFQQKRLFMKKRNIAKRTANQLAAAVALFGICYWHSTAVQPAYATGNDPTSQCTKNATATYAPVNGGPSGGCDAAGMACDAGNCAGQTTGCGITFDAACNGSPSQTCTLQQSSVGELITTSISYCKWISYNSCACDCEADPSGGFGTYKPDVCSPTQ
jgi:hypothetical protein